MALHAAPSAPDCQNVTGSIHHAVKHRCCLCSGVWLGALKVCQYSALAFIVRQYLRCCIVWCLGKGNKTLYLRIFLSGKAGGTWNGFNCVISLYWLYYFCLWYLASLLLRDLCCDELLSIVSKSLVCFCSPNPLPALPISLWCPSPSQFL